jgi:hypothetical protein
VPEPLDRFWALVPKAAGTLALFFNYTSIIYLTNNNITMILTFVFNRKK